MGVFYNPQGAMPIAQMGFDTKVQTAPAAMSSRQPKGRDIAAEKWDKEQTDEKVFDEIIANSVNQDTGEIDYAGASKSLRLKGLSKEADVAEEQLLKTSKARMEVAQQKEMDDLNDTAQALQLVTSGSPHLKKIGMTHLQKNDPDLVDVQPADKDGFFYNEVRNDGTINKVSAEKVWNSLVTAKDLLSLKQADDQFKFKVREESKRWSVDQLKALSLAKKARIDDKVFRGEKLNPNDLADTMTVTDLQNVADIYGMDPSLKVVYDIRSKDPKFPVRAMRDPVGLRDELLNDAKMLREAQKVLSEKGAPVAPNKIKAKGESIPDQKPNVEVEIQYRNKKQSVTATPDGLIIMKNKAGEERKVHPLNLKRAEELGYEPK